MKWDDVTGRADWINCEMLSNAADQVAVFLFVFAAKTLELNIVLVQQLYKRRAGCFPGTVLQSLHHKLKTKLISPIGS